MPPPTRCGTETEQSAGHNYHQSRNRWVGIRRGHIWVRLGDLTCMGSTDRPCDAQLDSLPPCLGLLNSRCVPHCRIPSLRTSRFNVPRWTRTIPQPWSTSCPPQALLCHLSSKLGKLLLGRPRPCKAQGPGTGALLLCHPRALDPLGTLETW